MAETQWMTKEEALRLYAIEAVARRLLAYEYPHPDTHPTMVGRQSWGALAILLDEQPTERSHHTPSKQDES